MLLASLKGSWVKATFLDILGTHKRSHWHASLHGHPSTLEEETEISWEGLWDHAPHSHGKRHTNLWLYFISPGQKILLSTLSSEICCGAMKSLEPRQRGQAGVYLSLSCHNDLAHLGWWTLKWQEKGVYSLNKNLRKKEVKGCLASISHTLCEFSRSHGAPSSHRKVTEAWLGEVPSARVGRGILKPTTG